MVGLERALQLNQMFELDRCTKYMSCVLKTSLTFCAQAGHLFSTELNA